MFMKAKKRKTKGGEGYIYYTLCGSWRDSQGLSMRDELSAIRVKSKTSFSDYTNPDKSPYTGADFQMMKEKFSQLMSEGQ